MLNHIKPICFSMTTLRIHNFTNSWKRNCHYQSEYFKIDVNILKHYLNNSHMTYVDTWLQFISHTHNFVSEDQFFFLITYLLLIIQTLNWVCNMFSSVTCTTVQYSLLPNSWCESENSDNYYMHESQWSCLHNGWVF